MRLMRAAAFRADAIALWQGRDSGWQAVKRGLMKKIGIIFGMENTIPSALVDRVNSMKVDGVQAEFVKLGGVKMAEPSGYRVIIDRI